jgi:hypothetical protein
MDIINMRSMTVVEFDFDSFHDAFLKQYVTCVS